MKHFSETSLVDFARGLVPASTRTAMQQHVAQCKECAAALATWRSVHAITREDSVLSPPADVVRVVKSQFAGVAPASEISPGVRLRFDSAFAPAAAGVRGAVGTRQFLYETDEFYIDLRVEPNHKTDRACLVGQVMNRGTDKQQAAQGLAVRLQIGKSKIAETLTNQFGEFQLDFSTANGLSIAVSRDEADHNTANEIVLPLYGVKN